MADYKVNGSIPVIATFVPANNNDFPLMRAHYVTDDNGKRLDELLQKLENINGKTVAIEVLSTDWKYVPRMGFFYIDIPKEKIKLTNPHVASVWVQQDNGIIAETIVKTSINIDNSLRVRTDIKINCKIIINGD
jgi:hypothetical protein